MRKLLLLPFSVICLSAGAQGIINNGAFIVMSGNAQVYIAGGGAGDYTSQANGRITPSATGTITLEGDWTNNAGNIGFTADAGTVVMNGAAQSIGGSTTTLFYNLTLQGTNTKTLNVNTGVGGLSTTTGVLSLGTRPLDLNSRTLTIYNPAPGTSITYTSGYILSETNAATNPSILCMRMISAGTYTFPFGTVGGVQIPVSMTTGATSMFVNAATRRTSGTNNMPWSTGVTHMFDPTLAQDGSDEAVIDRWWDFSSSFPGTVDITFRYAAAENTLQVPYNTGNLGAQYWQGGGWVPDNSNIGSAPAVLVGVGAVTAPAQAVLAGNTPWVLSSLSAPLPVELTSFTAACDDKQNGVTLNWTTASELNNDYFTIERSDDGTSFHTVGTVNGSGSSSQVHNYSFTDTQPLTGTTYYRLRQTDYNGQSTNSNIITQQPCGATPGETIGAYNTGSDVTVMVNAFAAGSYTVTLVDVQGKLIAERKFDAVAGANSFELKDLLPAAGVYLIRVMSDSGKQYNEKLFFGR